MRTLILILMSGALASSGLAAETIVDESFDQYVDGSGNPDQAAFEAVWRPDNGDGVEPPLGPPDPSETGILVPDNSGFLAPPNDNPPGLQGIGVNAGAPAGNNEWNGSQFALVPTPQESIRFGGDMFIDGVSGNWRQTIGLRNDTVDRSIDFGFQGGLNFLEMGLWNAAECDPAAELCDTANAEDPNRIASTQIAHRLVLFDSSSIGNVTRPVANFENGTLGMETLPLLRTPNWQYFVLHPDFDLPENGGDGDGDVDVLDIGEGWHTFTGEITDTSVTFQLDLFRNGVNEITGEAGPDSQVTYEIQMAATPNVPGNENIGEIAPFTSLRIGPPSTVTGNAEVVYDNVFLETVDFVVGLDGDYNGDGIVNAADYTLWRNTLGQAVGIGEGADGDRDGEIGPGDYDVWSMNYGATLGRGSTSIPEPSTILAIVATLSGISLFRSRRRSRSGSRAL